MDKPRARIGLTTLMVALLPLLLAGQCDEEGNPLDTEDFQTAVDLINHAENQQPVHIFVRSRSETFPCCQVAVGGARNVQMTLRTLTNYEFWAGRGGQELHSVTCRTILTANASSNYRVTWFETGTTGSLSCGGDAWQ